MAYKNLPPFLVLIETVSVVLVQKQQNIFGSMCWILLLQERSQAPPLHSREKIGCAYFPSCVCVLNISEEYCSVMQRCVLWREIEQMMLRVDPLSFDCSLLVKSLPETDSWGSCLAFWFRSKMFPKVSQVWRGGLGGSSGSQWVTPFPSPYFLATVNWAVLCHHVISAVE